MRKYDSILYIKSLGLPSYVCREFTYSQKKELKDYCDHLLSMGYHIGCRTDNNQSLNSSIGTPLLLPPNSTNDILNLVNTHKGRFTYIPSESFYAHEIAINGTVNILPGFNLFIAYNNLPNVPSCRHAIEDPRYQHGINYISIPFPFTNHNWNGWICRLRNHVKQAWLRDGELIGKRIEFSLYHDLKRFVFWQVLKDNL